MPSYRVVQTPFPFDKRRLAKGEVFEVNEKLGELFVAQGKAEPAEMLTPVDLPAEVMGRASKREPITEQEEEVKAKPKAPLSYSTRHMEAEKPKAVPKAVEKPVLTIQPVGQPVPVELPKKKTVAAKVEAPAPKKRGRPFGKTKK